MSQVTIRNAINSSLHIRWLLIFAWLSCLFGLIFAILPFVVNDAPGGMSILVFNISSLGLKAYNDSNPQNELHGNLRALVVPPIDNPASITKYMGAHDWYSISYLWTCRGWYEDVNGTLGKMYNSTCESRHLLDNTTISLFEMVRGELDLRAERLLEDLPDIEYRPRTWVSLWLSGLCFAALDFLTLPFAFDRRRLLGLRNWCLVPIALALVPFSIFIATLAVIKRTGRGVDGEFQAKLPDRFRHLSNLAITCMMSTFWTGITGWGVGRWLRDSFPGKPIKEEVAHEQHNDDRPVAQNDGLDEIEPRPFYEPLPSQPESTMPSPPPSPSGLERMMPTPIPEEEVPNVRRKEAHSM